MQPIQEQFEKDILPKREELFGVKNPLATPRIEKVVINARVKKGGSADEESIIETLTTITGQKAVPTKARKSISNFKIREGMVVGAVVTLRGTRALSFLDKLIHVTLPRMRDFGGLNPKAFDGKGNYTLGVQEHNIFPEVAGDDVAHLHGLQITIKTTAENDAQGLALLTALGFPFKK